MSMNLVSMQDRIAFRVGHIALAYKDTVLLWGGYKDGSPSSSFYTDSGFPSDELCVFDCYSETWHIKMLSGDIPPNLTGVGGAILGDEMYIYGGYYLEGEGGNANILYKLDLSKMEWRKLNPSGLKPVGCNKLVAWAYKHKVYFFGGYGEQGNQPETQFVSNNELEGAWNNQLVAYNPWFDRWEWPSTFGRRPLPRAAHACDISGNRVFIMGGRLLKIRMDGLYCLNMETMTWSDNLRPDERVIVPAGRSWHSLNFIAPNIAVVYGGLDSYSRTLNDCWILETSDPVRYRYFQSVFNTRRFWHKMVYNAVTGDLVCTGGTCYEKSARARDGIHIIARSQSRYGLLKKDADIPGFIIMNFLPKSLFRLAVDAILAEKHRTKPFWKHLPSTLRRILEARAEND